MVWWLIGAKEKSNHIRCVHANLIEGFWELALALPSDNPWRNDLRHLVHSMQGRKASVGTHTFSLLGCPSGRPVAAPVAQQKHPAAVGVPVLVHAHHLEA